MSSGKFTADCGVHCDRLDIHTVKAHGMLVFNLTRESDTCASKLRDRLVPTFQRQLAFFPTSFSPDPSSAAGHEESLPFPSLRQYQKPKTLKKKLQTRPLYIAIISSALQQIRRGVAQLNSTPCSAKEEVGRAVKKSINTFGSVFDSYGGA